MPQPHKPLSEPPTSDLHLLDQPAAPVDMDWDEEEPVTQHENVQGLPQVPDFDTRQGSPPPDIGDDDRTRQVYVGATFSGVSAHAEPPAAPVAPLSGEPTGPVAYSASQPSGRATGR